MAERYFNQYLLRAVSEINNHWAGKGYDKHSAYTHDLTFGTIKLKANNPPFTMCVAAQMEIIITALSIYSSETLDQTPYGFLPEDHWKSLNHGSFKDLVWVNSGSNGTSDALETYGLGEALPFSKLLPGAFININRKKSGHATLFISYIDKNGTVINQYGPNVVGFKYFSSQGSRETGGFGYRYAFFNGFCPSLDSSLKRDCGVIFSEKRSLLNTGQMLMPQFWSKDKRNEALKNYELKLVSESNSLLPEKDYNYGYLNGVTTDD